MGLLDFLRLPPAYPYVNRASVRNWLLNVERPDLDSLELLPPFTDPNYYSDSPSDDTDQTASQNYQPLPILPQSPDFVNPPSAMTKFDFSAFDVAYSQWENPYESAEATPPSYKTASNNPNNILFTEISSTPYTRSIGPVQLTTVKIPGINDDDDDESSSASEDEADERMEDSNLFFCFSQANISQ
jgi:hypothetical protein